LKSLKICSCRAAGEETLNAFMFRTHTHEHGRLVSAYLKKSGAEESKLLEERDPQKPQVWSLWRKLGAGHGCLAVFSLWHILGTGEVDKFLSFAAFAMCIFYPSCRRSFPSPTRR
jgi:hypothetical protein